MFIGVSAKCYHAHLTFRFALISSHALLWFPVILALISSHPLLWFPVILSFDFQAFLALIFSHSCFDFQSFFALISSHSLLWFPVILCFDFRSFFHIEIYFFLEVKFYCWNPLIYTLTADYITYNSTTQTQHCASKRRFDVGNMNT